MKRFDVGQTVQILANVGILLSIVFLAIQVSQNQATLDEENTLNALTGLEFALEGNSDFRRLLLNNRDLLEVWVTGNLGEPLSDIQKEEYEMLAAERLYLGLSLFNRFTALGRSEEAHDIARGIAGRIERSKRFSEQWVARRDRLVERGYQDFVTQVERID